MNFKILTTQELRNIKGGDAGSDLSNTVQTPSADPIPASAGSDLSNTVQ
ncbi:bacteriocin [Bacteroidota bacterium]